MKISKIITAGVISTTLAIAISGCTAANVSSQMRTLDNNLNMETKCVAVDMRDQGDMDSVLKKYDGWRVFYISEFTTEHKFGTSGSICLERKK